jgi:hypothetical protein
MGKSDRAMSPGRSPTSKSDSEKSPKAAHGMDKNPKMPNAVQKVRWCLAR